MDKPIPLFENTEPEKKIAWIENAEFLGGAELFSLDMLQKLEQEFSIPVLIDVYTSEESCHAFSEKLADCSKSFHQNIELHHKGLHLPRLKPLSFGSVVDAFSAIQDVVKKVREYQYDTVYCNTVRGALVVGIAQLFFSKRTKTIFMAHDYTFPSFLIRFIVTQFDQVLTCSYGVKQYLVENGLKAWKAEVVENGIEPELFSHLSPVVPPLFSVSVIGRIASWKGQMTVLQAAKWLQENALDYPFHFHIYGDPSPREEDQLYFEELKNFAKEHSLNNITFHGFSPLDTALGEHHIVVHAAEENEPFGRVPLEAAAAGKILCLSDIGTPSQVFEDKKNAFFFIAGESQSLAETLVIIAHNKDKAMEAAEKAKTMVVEKFNLPVLAHRFWGYF